MKNFRNNDKYVRELKQLVLNDKINIIIKHIRKNYSLEDCLDIINNQPTQKRNHIISNTNNIAKSIGISSTYNDSIAVAAIQVMRTEFEDNLIRK